MYFHFSVKLFGLFRNFFHVLFCPVKTVPLIMEMKHLVLAGHCLLRKGNRLCFLLQSVFCKILCNWSMLLYTMQFFQKCFFRLFGLLFFWWGVEDCNSKLVHKMVNDFIWFRNEQCGFLLQRFTALSGI